MNFEKSNPLLKKLRRESDQHKPTGTADAFFGSDSSSKIIEITESVMRYTDEKGELRVLLFDDCKYCSDVERDYVGRRGLLSSPPWVEFFDPQRTRFEFESRSYANLSVMSALRELNIRTIDMD